MALIWDVLNASGHRLETLHARLAPRFVRFLEGEGIGIEDLEKRANKK